MEFFKRKSIQKKHGQDWFFFWGEQEQKGKLRVTNASVKTLVNDENFLKIPSYR